MPTYNLKNTETGEVEEKFLSISQMEALVASGKYKVIILTAPGDLGHTDGILSKTSSGWKDLLKTIKKNSGRGNTIKV